MPLFPDQQNKAAQIYPKLAFHQNQNHKNCGKIMSDIENSNTPIESLGKFGLIDRLASKAEKLNASTLKGPGDDSCIIDTGTT